MNDLRNSTLADNVSVPLGRFLVIGCGSIGKRHLRNLQRLGVKDIAAVDVHEGRLEEVRKKLGVHVFDDLDTALCSGVKTALICTPTSLHIPHALAAARAGCHLFIEKPLSHSLEDVDELVEEVERHGLVTLVGCNFRFHPGLQQTKTLLEEGAIGPVVSARAEFGQYLPDWHPWEDYRCGYSAQRGLGGGVILDRIHEFDYVRWLLGEVTEVYCMADHLSGLEIDTEDIAEVIMRFTTGVVASIHLDYVRRTYKCELEVVGEEGTIRWSFQHRSVSWYVASKKVWHRMQWPHYETNDMYLAEIKHFFAALAGQEDSIQDVRDAKRVLEIALAAKHSAETGRKVIL